MDRQMIDRQIDRKMNEIGRLEEGLADRQINAAHSWDNCLNGNKHNNLH